MDDSLNKQFPNHTPRELLREAIRADQMTYAQVAMWTGDDRTERWARQFISEGSGRLDNEQLSSICRNLRRRGMHGLALELTRAANPDYDISHSARPTFDECDHDQNGDVNDADLRHHAAQACERLIACLNGDCKDPHEVAALADTADMHITRLIHSARLQAAKGPKETRRDHTAPLKITRQA